MDKLDEMKIFVRVADAGRFAEAARQLDLSPTCVTRAVRALEDRLGVRLLHRTTRSLRLTEAGERYLHAARDTLEQIDCMEETLRREHAGESGGTLRLRMPVYLGTRHLVPLLAEFKQQHPHLRMDLDFSDAPVDIVSDGFDAAIRVTTGLDDSSLHARRIGSSAVVLSASPAYLQRHDVPRTPEHLRLHQVLHYADQGTASLAAHTQQVGALGTASTIRANNGDALKSMALAGLGLVRAPAFIVADELADGRLVRVLPHADLGAYVISIVFAARRLMPLRTRNLIEHLTQRLTEVGMPAHPSDSVSLRAAA